MFYNVWGSFFLSIPSKKTNVVNDEKFLSDYEVWV